MDTAGHFQVFLWNRRPLLSFWYANMFHEIRELVLWWLPGTFPALSYPTIHIYIHPVAFCVEKREFGTIWNLNGELIALTHSHSYLQPHSLEFHFHVSSLQVCTKHRSIQYSLKSFICCYNKRREWELLLTNFHPSDGMNARVERTREG